MESRIATVDNWSRITSLSSPGRIVSSLIKPSSGRASYWNFTFDASFWTSTMVSVDSDESLRNASRHESRTMLKQCLLSLFKSCLDETHSSRPLAISDISVRFEGTWKQEGGFNFLSYSVVIAMHVNGRHHNQCGSMFLCTAKSNEFPHPWQILSALRQP